MATSALRRAVSSGAIAKIWVPAARIALGEVVAANADRRQLHARASASKLGKHVCRGMQLGG